MPFESGVAVSTWFNNDVSAWNGLFCHLDVIYVDVYHSSLYSTYTSHSFNWWTLISLLGKYIIFSPSFQCLGDDVQQGRQHLQPSAIFSPKNTTETHGSEASIGKTCVSYIKCMAYILGKSCWWRCHCWTTYGTILLPPGVPEEYITTWMAFSPLRKTTKLCCNRSCSWKKWGDLGVFRVPSQVTKNCKHVK